MDQEKVLNMSLEQENETERVSRRGRRDNSIDSLSRQSLDSLVLTETFSLR